MTDSKNRLISLFEYFKAVELRRKPRVLRVQEHHWALPLAQLPKHPALSFDPGRALDDDGCWFKVKKPKTTEPPKPPIEIAEWLEAGWQTPSNQEPEYRQSIVAERNGSFREERFDSDPIRKKLFSDWLSQWRFWSAAEMPVRQVEGIWNQLFSMHGDLTREGERLELMLGDGFVAFSNGQIKVSHPLVLKRVSRVFDPVEKEFRFSDKDETSEFYSATFVTNDFVSLDVKKWRSSLEQQDLHPLDGEPLSHYLKGVAGSIENGEFVSQPPDEQTREPRLFRNPVLFVRKRETGLAEFIDEILEDIPNADGFPSSLLGIVGINPPAVDDPNIGLGDDAYANEREDLLLTKPANAEQVEILRRLSRNSDVLVQGPPGTGKTHTIANLIGSLLSEGKSVLVTSHSTKALRVVREKVAEPLRGLCVSVLDNDKESRSQREGAIRDLSARLSDDPGSYLKESDDLRDKRLSLLNSIRKARKDLLDAVEGEYRPIVLQGQQTLPADAAKEIAAGMGLHDWIPGPIDNDAPMPLGKDEIEFLYSAGRLITREDELELDGALPAVADIPAVPEFEGWVDDERTIESDPLLHFRPDLWRETGHQASVIELLEHRLQTAIALVKDLASNRWKLSILDAGINGGSRANVWQLLCGQARRVRESSSEFAEISFNFRPVLHEDTALEIQLKVLREIELHIGRKGAISWLKLNLTTTTWSRHIKAWRTNDRQPERLDDFTALRRFAELEIARKELVRNWEAMCVPLGMASLEGKSDPEEYAIQFIPQIDAMLGWHGSTWLPLQQELEACGLDWKVLSSEAPATEMPEHQAIRLIHTVEKSLPNVVRSECLRRKFAALKMYFVELLNYLDKVQSQRQAPSLLTARLIASVKTRSVLEYEQAFLRVERLHFLFPDHQRRTSLLGILGVYAPSWVTALKAREPDVLGRDQREPFEPMKAWRHLQFIQELERRSALSVSDILGNLSNLTQELERVTISLVEKRAWLGLLRKVTPEQKRALLGWALTMKRIGAGTGRLVPELRKQAKREMENARGAVPVWIMPFASVTSTFHPVRDRFDILIVDEASQEDILGLASFYMADKVIVVGDDEQVTPLDVGGQMESVQNLMSQWLGDLPAPRLFDTKTSIYDRAQISFGSVIRLREHFRCVPEIIQFSNALCYDFSIRPLRESASTPLKPPLVAHRVDGFASQKKNPQEASEVVRLLRACLEFPEYAGKTFGVISMVGDEQTRLIESQLRQCIDPVVYEDRRILCGNSAQFQGDERDVIFLSLVDSKSDLGPLSLRQDGADGMWKKRFNVAASRARDQLWVVHSLDHVTQLKPDDIRRRLIEHALDPSALMERLNSVLQRTESPFEVEVLKILLSRGYRVTPQWQVGAYRIDMVVEGSANRLAIECDGDRWHYDKAAQDLARQALLERLGWTFVRIRGSVFYRDKSEHREYAMAPVFKRLQELGIHPDDSDAEIEAAPVNELLEEIKRKASSLQQTAEPSSDISYLSDLKEEKFEKIFFKPDPPNFSVRQGALFDRVSSQAPTNNLSQVDIKTITSFSRGVRVSHPKFGAGEVLEVTGTGGDMTVKVDFAPPWGVKTLSAKLANLSIIDV